MNEKSMTASSQACSSIAAADDHRVAEAGGELGLGDALRVGAEVEEASGSSERRSAASSWKVPLSASCSIRSRARTGK